MKLIAIESSCDETSAAVVEKQGTRVSVLSSVTATSIELHAKTGGIIPENAARMQVKYIMPVVTKALIESKKTKKSTKKNDWKNAKEILENEIDGIAVTNGPGLIGSLLVGVETAKTFAYVFDKPIVPVNHLLGHIYANFISPSVSKSQIPDFPFIGLIVSGGHTDLLFFKSHEEYEWLGGTRDDAAGEAFDKIGRFIGLPYPAGPEIERLAGLALNHDIRFKSPLINENNFDFSFSGLKTEVTRYFENNKTKDILNEVCYSTQKAIVDVLITKVLKAAKERRCKSILVGGGVSANNTFKKILEERSLENGIKSYFPQKNLCTDNAAMIGSYALLNYKPINWIKVNANPELYFA